MDIAKTIGKWVGIIIVMAALVCGGCAKIMGYWPAETNPVLKTYVSSDCKKAGIDPNNYGWDCMWKLKAMLQLAKQKNALTQSYIVYQAREDNIQFGDANSIGKADYQAAEQERSTFLSWAAVLGISLLTGGTGAGIAGLIVNAIKNSSMYSEAEHQIGVQTAIANNYTKDEVQAILDKVRLGQTVVL